MTNILKHSGASRVVVRLAVLKDSIELRIRDNGVGFDPGALQLQKRDRFGLVGMRERIRILDGTFMADSKPGQGTTVYVVLPPK